MQFFDFYLDAYHFCVRKNISLDKIVKRSFREWVVDIDGIQNET